MKSKQLLRQMCLRLFANASNQCSAKTMMSRSKYSEILFYTSLQQHSSYDALVYCFAVVLSYWFTTAKLQIKVSEMGCGFRKVEFRLCQSVAMCLPINVAIQEQGGVVMKLCGLAHPAVCGIAQ